MYLHILYQLTPLCVITHLEPDILEHAVKWALGSIRYFPGGSDGKASAYNVGDPG